MGALIALFVWWAPVWLTILIASLCAVGMIGEWIYKDVMEPVKAEETA